MKKIIFMALTVLMCAGFTGCGSDDETKDTSKELTDMELTGHYICTDFEFRNAESGEIGSNGKNISDPVDINADHTFAVDQMVNGKVFMHSEGTWKRNGSEVSFTYKDSDQTNTGTFTYRNKVMNIAGTTNSGYTFNIRLVRQ
jgi:hypothetical protein